MTPNPVVLFSKLLKPHKWGQRRQSSKTERVQQHWDTPYPGTYEHKPGRGWYLVAFDEGVDHLVSESVLKYKPEKLPHPVTFCKLLNRWMFAEEYKDRRRFERVKQSDGEARSIGFFLLDDGVTYVACWDDTGAFTDGPYQRWYFDEEQNRMKRLKKHVALVDREDLRKEGEASGKNSLDNVPTRSTVADTSKYSVCSCSRSGSVVDAALRMSPSSSTTAGSSVHSAGTAITTPSSGLAANASAKELDPDVLDDRLRTLHSA